MKNDVKQNQGMEVDYRKMAIRLLEHLNKQDLKRAYFYIHSLFIRGAK